MKKYNLALLLIILIFIFTVDVQAMDFRDFAVERLMDENYEGVKWHPQLSINDLATREQAENRIDSLMYWCKEFNHMFPEMKYQRLVKDGLEIMLHETYAVNWYSHLDNEGNRYGVLDDGESFGIYSMSWETAYWIAEVNKWDLHDREDELRLMSDTHEQTKYAIWYLYWLLNFMESKAENKGVNLSIRDLRLAMIDGYNLPSIDPTKERDRKYFFVVFGRISYQDVLIKQKVNEVFNWSVI